MQAKVKRIKSSNAKVAARRLVRSLAGFAQAKGARQSVYLLIGDPGTGKTSFIRTFASILDMGLLVIEAPHIIPEQLIRIPYYTVKGDKKSKTKTVEIQYSSAYIWDELHNLSSKIKQSITKQEALKRAQRYGSTWVEILEEAIWPAQEVTGFRDKVKVILFIDEFYRTTNERILVTLRNIAFNRKIGDKFLPKEVYVVLASNMSDIGVVDIPANNTFQAMNFAYGPEETKDFWVKNVGIDRKLADRVIKAITDKNGELLLGKDEESGTYYERRRLTNLLQIINDSETPEEKRLAATILENHFRDPVELEEEHKIAANVKKAVEPFLKGAKPYDKKQWMKAVEEYIKLVHKISSKKHYDNVLVIPSQPGIGKTTMIRTIASKLGARLAEVDVSTLTVDSATGVIKINEAGSVEFSNPELYDLIKTQLQFTEKDFDPKSITPGKPRFIVFLDELNRPIDERILNVIRLLLKEKRVGESEDTKLPPDTIIVTALNPSDSQTVELSMHLKDVLDAIPAAPSAKALKQYMYRTYASDNPTVKKQIDAFFEMLTRASAEKDDKGNRLSEDELPFWLGSPDNPRWLPPREIDKIFQSLNVGVAMLQQEASKVPPEQLQTHLLKKLYEEIMPDIIDDITSTLVVDDPSPNNPIKNEVEDILYNVIKDQELARAMLAPILGMVRTEAVYDLKEIYDEDNDTFNVASLTAWYADISLEKATYQIAELINKALQLDWPEAGRKVATIVTNFYKASQEAFKKLEAAEIETKDDPTVILDKVLLTVDQEVASQYYKIACKYPQEQAPKVYEEIKALEKEDVVKEYAAIMQRVRTGNNYIPALRSEVINAAKKKTSYRGCTPDIVTLAVLLAPKEYATAIVKFIKKGGRISV